MEHSVFLYWLKMQEHKWNERNKRMQAINRLRGLDLPIKDFPIGVAPDQQSIYEWSGWDYIDIEDTQEFMDKVAEMIDVAFERGY